MTYLKKKIISWSVIATISVGLFIFMLWNRGGFTNFSLYVFIDACFYPGIIMVLVGGLVWTTSEGVFDVFRYGFQSVYAHMGGDRDKQAEDYTGYKKRKSEQRKYSKPMLLPYFCIGGAFLIAGIVLAIIFYYVYIL